MAPPVSTGAADEGPSPFSLKRGTSEDDSDAVLADAFGDDDGCEIDALPASEPMTVSYTHLRAHETSLRISYAVF